MNEMNMNNAPLSEQLIALAEFWCEDVPYGQSTYYPDDVLEANRKIVAINQGEYYGNHPAMCYFCLLEAEFQKDKEEALAKMMENILA